MSLSVNLQTALNNIDTLLTFKHGDIPVTDQKTGELTKEDWNWGRTIKRYFNGFDPLALVLTFDTVLEYLQGTYETPKSLKDLKVVDVKENAQNALAKVLLIKSRYDKQVAKSWIYKDSSKTTSENLQNIYDTYSYKLGKCPGRNGTKKEYFQRSISVQVMRITENGKKKAAKINQKVIDELRQSFIGLELNHVETEKKKVVVDHTEGFNTKLLESVHKEKKVEESDSAEWSTEESEKAILERTVSLPPRKLTPFFPMTGEFLSKIGKRKKEVDKTATVYIRDSKKRAVSPPRDKVDVKGKWTLIKEGLQKKFKRDTKNLE